MKIAQDPRKYSVPGRPACWHYLNNFTQLQALGPDFPSFCRHSLWEEELEERRRESSEEEERKAEEGKASVEKEKKKLSAW